MPQQVPFDTLPDEMVLSLFEALPPRDRLIASRVCKRWRALAIDRSLWTAPVDMHTAVALAHIVAARQRAGLDFNLRLTFVIGPANKDTRVAPIFERAREMGMDLTGLALCMHALRIMATDYKEEPTPLLTELLGTCLEEVRLACPFNASLIRSHLSRLPNLKRLLVVAIEAMEFDPARPEDDFFTALFQSCPHLEDFGGAIYPSKWMPRTPLTPASVFAGPTQLRVVKLSVDDPQSLWAGEGFFSHAWHPHLEVLNFDRNSGPPIGEAMRFGDEPPRGLRELHCTAQEENWTWTLNYPSLETLEMSDRNQSWPTRAPFTTEKFPRLRRLRYDNPYPDCVAPWLNSSLLDSLPSLREIEFVSHGYANDGRTWTARALPVEVARLECPGPRAPPLRAVLASGHVVTITREAGPSSKKGEVVWTYVITRT